MAMQATTTYTLSDADVIRAVAEFVSREKGVPVSILKVKIDIDPGSPHFNALDAGRPASVKVTAEVPG